MVAVLGIAVAGYYKVYLLYFTKYIAYYILLLLILLHVTITFISILTAFYKLLLPVITKYTLIIAIINNNICVYNNSY